MPAKGSGKRPICHPYRAYGGHGMCKPCYYKKWRKEHPEQTRALAKKNYNARPEAARRVERIRIHGQRAADQYDVIHNCQACGDPVAGKCKHIDHDHTVSDKDRAFRGILCFHCNRALGYVHDSSRRLLNLAEYLEQYEKMKKLSG